MVDAIRLTNALTLMSDAADQAAVDYALLRTGSRRTRCLAIP
jgi:hypothetical protein